MNIFYLNKDPMICSQMHCDKHVVKMILEYAQLLCTAHHVLDGDQAQFKDVLYRKTHTNHPSAIWARESEANYKWLFNLFKHCTLEYQYRYQKVHATWKKLGHLLHIPPANIPVGDFTDPPPAMKAYPQCIVPGDSVQSYINYYREAKSGFAKWTVRKTPEFMKECMSTTA